MQIFILIISAMMIFSSCQNRIAEEKNSVKSDIPNNKNVTDSLRIQEILSFNDLKSASFAIFKDTVYILNAADSKKKQDYIIRQFYYDSLNSRFRFTNNIVKPDSFDVDRILKLAEKSPMYFKSIGSPRIKYSKSPAQLENLLQLDKEKIKDIKVQLFKDRYVFFNKTATSTINIYNASTNKLDSFNIKSKLFEVTDFFLCDLDNDDNPEIFIFHIGYLPREDAISYTVFSIRKDSVDVMYK